MLLWAFVLMVSVIAFDFKMVFGVVGSGLMRIAVSQHRTAHIPL